MANEIDALVPLILETSARSLALATVRISKEVGYFPIPPHQLKRLSQ